MIGQFFYRRNAEGGSLRSAARARPLPWFAVGLSLPLLSIGLLLPREEYQSGLELNLQISELQPAVTLPLLFNSTDLVSAGSFGGFAAGAAHDPTLTLEVRRGDTLDRLFRRQGLNLGDLQNILKLQTARENLRILKPGDKITVTHNDGNILTMSRQLDVFRSLNISFGLEGFGASIETLEYDTRATRTSGTITSSLFGAAAQAGVSDRAIMNLASIFASDIDFVLDLREGDEFTIVYEEMWRDGEKLADGEILAAEFVNQGRSFRAVRYQASDGRVGYYTPEGRSMRKAFVRVPLAFTRVSSEFNPRRRHPILNTIRAHTGVDYAAPTGTPIRAPGDGKVVFSGRKGGYGNAIILQHAGGITTLYGHLSRFASSIRPGRHVSQGDTIGYVGATGLATAPHLHYEYRVNGRHMNPRTVKLPNAATPLDASERANFARVTAPLLRKLETGESMLASDKPSAGSRRQTS